MRRIIIIFRDSSQNWCGRWPETYNFIAVALYTAGLGELHTSILNERWVLDNLAAITNDHSVENLLELMYNAVLCSNSCIRICFKLSTGIQQRWMFTGEFLWDLWVDTAVQLRNYKNANNVIVLRLTDSTVTLAWIIQDTGCIAIGSGLLIEILHQSLLHNRNEVRVLSPSIPKAELTTMSFYDALEDNIELIPVCKLHTVHRGLCIHWSQQWLAVTGTQWPTAESKMCVTCLQYSSYPRMHNVIVLWYLWV